MYLYMINNILFFVNILMLSLSFFLVSANEVLIAMNPDESILCFSRVSPTSLSLLASAFAYLYIE